jgi:hypothetical protein
LTPIAGRCGTPPVGAGVPVRGQRTAAVVVVVGFGAAFFLGLDEQALSSRAPEMRTAVAERLRRGFI